LARAPRAAGVRLSIDLDLAWCARTALGENRGSIVLLDAWTGSVLAAVSDTRTNRDHETPALEQYREPASIAKLITTAAALRAGLDPDAEISHLSCNGAVRYPTGTLWCPWGDGALHGLDHAMAVSCNTSFAELGARVGREGLLDEFRRWGFDRADVDLPGSGRIVAPEGDDRQLGDLAIGLEATDITPLHAALMAAVFANGGSMPAPRFVAAADGRLGRSPVAFPRRDARPVIPDTWLPRLRQSMLAVAAPGGTASFLAPPGFPVAMKTGTASLPGAGYHVNYIGIGPMPEPRLAFEVRITHQPSSPRARRAAREVTQTLLHLLEARTHHLRRPGRADPAVSVPDHERVD
jgi:cell division protein FtsI/penicillin-binding protein 2